MSKDFMLFAIFFIVLVSLALPLGRYLEGVFFGQGKKQDQFFGPIERVFYRLAGIDERLPMNAWQYGLALVLFNVLGMMLVFILQLSQGGLPFNPQQLPAVESWHLALNTAVSFMTNTNWQSYGGESTVSYSTQMTALTVQNFLSAATGCAVAVALIRGLTEKETSSLGNFWQDLVRGTIRVFLPLSIVFALFFVQQGVIQNLSPYETVTTVEGGQQIIAMGPVASQEAIKLLGTNGGGFFNANSAHPFENPTALTNFMQMTAILLVPLALVFMFGRRAGSKKHGYAIAMAMGLLFFLMLGINYSSEINGNALVAAQGIDGSSVMEGKEVRFGVGGSSLYTTVTTAASCGAVNNMHDSLTPLGGLVPMLQMMLGEVVIGGVGAGFYGIMIYVLITVFIVGLMVGRTPEYLGKKIEAKEMKWTMAALLLPSLVVLSGSAIAAVSPAGLEGLNNSGPHGLSEMVYAFASAAGNNGSAFAGLTANTLFYNVMLAAAMFIGRFGVILPILVAAGSLAEKKSSPAGLGTFDTGGVTFTLLLVGIILIVGALTFLPALSLGPIVEQLLLAEGITF